MITHYVSLDVSKRDCRKVIPICTGDTGHRIIFTIQNGDKIVEFDGSTNATVTVRNGANDGAGVVDDCEVYPTDNVIEYSPSHNAVAKEGNIVCILTVFDSNNNKLFAPFYLYVAEDGAKNIDTQLNTAVMACKAWSVITTLKNSAFTTVQAVTDATSAKEAAESAKEAAESAKTAAESAKTAIEQLYANKLTMVTDGTDVADGSYSGKLYAVTYRGVQHMRFLSGPTAENKRGTIPMYYGDSKNPKEVRLYVDSPVEDYDATPKKYVDGAVAEAINGISLDYAIDENYTLTLRLKKGEEIINVVAIPLPLESLIVNIEDSVKDSGERILILTPRNGTPVEVPLDEIFKGFVSEDEFDSNVKQLEAGLSQKVDITTYNAEIADLEAGLSEKVDNTTYNAEIADLEAGLSKKVDKDTVQEALAQKVNTTDFEKVKQELNTTDIRLTNIEARFSDDAVIDSTVAYEKAVPANALPYAEVQKVGGMTYKVKPGLSAIYIEMSNSDGSITINNSDGQERHYDRMLLDYDNSKGHYFALADECPYIKNTNLKVTYVHGNDNDGVTGADVVLYPLNSWIPSWSADDYYMVDKHLVFTTTTEAAIFTFTPVLVNDLAELTPKLLDTKVTELVSEGANLFEYPYFSSTITTNGITFTDNGDGTVTANGTSTAIADFPLMSSWIARTLKSGNYYLSGCADGGGSTKYKIELAFRTASGDVSCDVYNNAGKAITLSNDVTNQFGRIRIYSGVTVNNLVFKPMLNRGTSPAPYKPYRADAVDTFSISAKLIAFLEQYGYGRGVEGYPNYIDFARKVFVQNTCRKVFDGTEDISRTTNSSRNYERYVFVISPSPCSDSNAITCISTHMTSSSFDTVFAAEIKNAISAYNTAIHWTDERMTIAEMQAKLKAWYDEGNPLIVEYILQTPVEIDISAYLTDDNFIEVEAGGGIKAVNEYEYGAPSTIEYQTEVVE